MTMLTKLWAWEPCSFPRSGHSLKSPSSSQSLSLQGFRIENSDGTKLRVWEPCSFPRNDHSLNVTAHYLE